MNNRPYQVVLKRYDMDSYYSLIWYFGRSSYDWWFDYGE